MGTAASPARVRRNRSSTVGLHDLKDDLPRLIDEREAAEKEKRPYVYSRRWMAETAADRAKYEAQGRQAVVRLKIPREGACEIRDHIRGDVRVEWAAKHHPKWEPEGVRVDWRPRQHAKWKPQLAHADRSRRR